MHLLGTAAAGSVRTDAYVRVGRHNALTRHLVSDSATIALLNHASTLTADPNRFDENELRALVARGALANLPAPVPPGAVYANVGDECNPEDSPVPGLACTPTSDWVIEPPEMLNAFKGNFIMDHGCGNIGQLLGAVGQLYSHTSIIVKNRVEVRHASSSGDRIAADIDNSPLPYTRLKPDTLRYQFPGTEGTALNPLPGTEGTHSIDEMTREYSATDPEGRTWRMGNEFQPSQDNKCDVDITAVPPLVIRPDPACAQTDLGDVAVQANNIEGHYRFFNYSHADTRESCAAPWCSGQPSIVCSLFARDSAVGKGAKHRPLWPNGAITNPSQSIDGMRPYSVDSRTAGAHAYFSQMHDTVASIAHPWDTLFDIVFAGGYPVAGSEADAIATRVANQMVNCFASDGCDDTENTWETNGVGSGIAVSPDDMIQWDSCNPRPGEKAGTYGYNEPAVYLASVFRHKYALGPAAGTGRMTVVVKDDSVPGKGIAGVTVILDSEVKGSTGSDGSLEIAPVPAGGHIVEAQQYTGPALTPLVLAPTPEQILAMPVCPAFPDCQASDCPSGWTKGSTSATTNGHLSDGTPEVNYQYACYPPRLPPPGCDLLNATRAPPTTNVTSGQETVVTLTLCEVATCSDGVRAACPQNCTASSDCDNNLACTNGKCTVPPRLVHITDSTITGIVSGDCSQSANVTANVDVICDPTSQTGLTDWLCDQGHQNFCTLPIVGGVADQTFQLNGNGDCNTLLYHFVCTMDPLVPGGIIVATDQRLLEGCGSNNTDDEGNAHQWLAHLPVATQQTPLPAPAVCLVNHGNTGPGNAWNCAAAEASFYTDEAGRGDSYARCDNEVDIGLGMNYANVPKP